MSTVALQEFVKQALLEKLESLAASLPQSLDDLAAAEQVVRSGVLELGRELLQQWSAVATAQVSAPVCEACEEAMRHKGYATGPLVTTLGDLRVRRARFRCEHCGAECYPHDARLRFRGHAVSWPLAKVIGRLGAQLPFAQACESLRVDYGVKLSKHTVETICEHAGAALLDAEDARRSHLQSLPVDQRSGALPDSELSPEKAYVFGDGAMIHTGGDWHEIRVASVAATDAADTPLAVDHRARFLSCEDFGWQLLLMSRGVGFHRAKLKAFIADGARWLWDVAATQFPDAVQILDWYHLSEHVHQTAAAVYGEGVAAAKEFSRQRLEELWEGRVNETLRALGALHKSLRAVGKREALRKFIGYLNNNRERIDYPRYRAQGLKVGSGQVESACKTLVGQRCKQAGMRNWTRRGAEGVLRLRAALQTGQFDRLWDAPCKTAA